MVGVRKERKIQTILFSELLLCGRWIRTDPDHSHFQLIEMLPGISQANRLDRSARRPSLWVEEEKNLASPKICKGDLLSILIYKSKIWRPVGWFKCHGPLPFDRWMIHFPG